MANLYVFLSTILRSHSVTSLASFHRLILRKSRSLWFIFSRMFLLIRPFPFFAGFINLTQGLFLKFGLWSFNVIKHSFLPFVNILSPSSVSFQRCLFSFQYDRLPLYRSLLLSSSAFCYIAFFYFIEDECLVCRC